jgi:hypothetical protein
LTVDRDSSRGSMQTRGCISIELAQTGRQTNSTAAEEDLGRPRLDRLSMCGVVSTIRTK